MLRDFKFMRRNSGKNPILDEIENIPINQNVMEEPEVSSKSIKVDKTPTKAARSRYSDVGTPHKTPDKRGVSVSNRFGWPQKNESSSNAAEGGVDVSNFRNANVGHANMTTPRSTKAVGRGNSGFSESNSTQTTPSKSVSKPPNPGLCLTGGARPPPANGGARMANFAALSRGLPISGTSSTVVNTVEVPYFAMKEDSSFWMDHNVQVLIRVRPLNSMEKSTHGYNRCLKQESAQCITWVGHPETRFTFDHVACESVDQETLFRMVGLPMVENCLSGYNSCMFAYGQTGSGKTYTMLGDIDELGVKPSLNRGMTPRIFEFLFGRIQAEEESRRDERLTYNCKCSFLEIYNEQITDLLEPSSTNLLLREDIKTGVYVENLSEFEVHTVGDILKLLSTGSSNRKVAATNMNRESSRSHSVFTCVIESRWEKESTSNLRFARLNLVDLAGSERQKTSGAEGERLKEAANINKSLSTLGHVIMVLVDVAHAKTKHVPYRDSRLTFLLQDSLGGNSKTMIIANVSPSICSAAETLNTLKFAQRAKLIQNNAVVNEDSSGDVIALQHQIRLLKEEVLALKRQNVSRSLSFGSTIVEDTREEDASASKIKALNNKDQQSTDDMQVSDSKGRLRFSSKQLKCLETTLTGALRREQMAESSIKQLEAEIEHLNRLVRQREEDTRCTKMMLKFREEKIQRMENLLGGLLPTDAYLLEENKALWEEIQQLRAKVDKNPEVTRFALENIRLLEQLRRFQDFYEEGEREILLTEVSEMRDQLVSLLDGNLMQQNHPNTNFPSKEVEGISKENASLHLELKKTLDDLEECRRKLNSCLENNAKLSREIDDLRAPLNHMKPAAHDNEGSVEVIKESILEVPSLEKQLFEPVQLKNGEMNETLMKHTQEVMELQLELDILKIILKEERSSCGDLVEKADNLTRDLELAEGKTLQLTEQHESVKEELREAKSVIEALETQQLISISELEDLRNSANCYVELLREQELKISSLKEQVFEKEIKDRASSKLSKVEDSPLQRKLKRMHDSLDKAKKLNTWYQNDLASHASNEEEMDEVRRQAEAETAEVIVCLQEDLNNLQHQVHDGDLKERETEGRLMLLHTELKELQNNYEVLTQNNKSLCEQLEEKDKQLKMLSAEREQMITEIEVALAGGYEALEDAADQLDSISGSDPLKSTCISEQLGRMARSISEKELMIEELNHCLEDTNTKKHDLERMLRSLRGAALVITEAHEKDCSEKEKEIILLTSQLGEKQLTIAELENKIKHGEEQLRKASTCATVAFLIVSRLSEVNSDYVDALKHKNIQLTEAERINLKKDGFIHNQALEISVGEKQINNLRLELEGAEEECGKLRLQLCEEEKRASDMEIKLDEIEGNNILNTSEKLTELKDGILTLISCMDGSEVMVADPEDNVGRCPICVSTEAIDEARTGTGENQSSNNLMVSAVGKSSRDQRRGGILKDASGRDATVDLLKEEIEAALESLKGVQVEMVTLRTEKDEVCNSEKRTQQQIKSILSQALALQESISNFGDQVGLAVGSLDYKLKRVEYTVKDTAASWFLKNETFEHELSESKMLAVQKTAETSCILAKFEDAQDTIREADTMVNELMIANERRKSEIEGMKKERVILMNEKDNLINEVQILQASNNQKDWCYKNLEKQVESDIIAISGLVQELEGMVSQLQITFKEDLISISSDFLFLKSKLYDSKMLVQSWLDDIWSEIIVKDCAMSVFHLCHMGLLLETIGGLNVENGLLHHGLCESNSLIFELRENNIKSRKELEMCRVLEGKLLADIKNSFDRISRKEDETGKLSIKVTSFEKKILDLQLQEDLMLQRSSSMGSELAMLLKELDNSNRNVLVELFDREKKLKDKEDALGNQEEKFLIDLSAKDFDFLVLAFEYEQMAVQKTKLEKTHTSFSMVLEELKRDMVLLSFEAELKEFILFESEAEVTHLVNEIEISERERHDFLSELKLRNLEISEIKEANTVFAQEIKLLKEVACSNDTLKNELVGVTEEKMRLLSEVKKLQSECYKLLEDLKTNETALGISANHVSVFDQQNQALQSEIILLETSLSKLQKEMDTKSEELIMMKSIKEENESWRNEVMKSKEEYHSVLYNLEEKKSEIESLLGEKEVADIENHRLQDDISSLEGCISNLQIDMDRANVELNQLRHSESELKGLLSSRTKELQIHAVEANTLKEENICLRNELIYKEEHKFEALRTLSLKIEKFSDSLDVVDMTCSRVCNIVSEEDIALEKTNEEMQKNVERASDFVEEFENLENITKELIRENLSLQAELKRKDEVLEGMLFDLRLLQEAASKSKDEKDEFEELLVSFEGLENELSVRSHELNEALGKGQTLEAQLQEKTDQISTLELEVSREWEHAKSLSNINLELTTNIANAIQEKRIVEEESIQKRKENDRLGLELLEMSRALEQMNNFIESLKINLHSITCERDDMHAELFTLKNEFEMAQALAEENEAIAIEAQQVAETRKLYADEKEEEVRLLERSVEELERTVDVLESNVDIVKGEAELQRLQREKLELELHTVKQKMLNVEIGDAELKRNSDVREKSLEEALQSIQILEREIAARDSEISQCKVHISELNLHAEAQALEYKQKFKALEVMAEQVKSEIAANHTTNSSTNKLEKSGSRTRGSGSPFKCIGLGIVQQIKSERDDDELTAGRLRIEELENLAAQRQKEIFMLNARLATAESMTHDVLRDLLGLKSDMTGYATLVDNQQVQKITEKALFHNAEVQDQEVINLKQQLSEFVEERKGWLEEIDRKQAELVAAQIALEKLHQHDRLLATENEMLKMENVTHKKKVMELETEVNKLSGQQNIQQRIHHHAKIKEENNMLKAQNEDLCSKLQRRETILSRIKEELLHFRAANGLNPCINFDEEQRLNQKLKESEEERLQLAQRLLSLCTSILKAAGITRPASDINLSVAEEALEQLKDRPNILERELQELKLKSRITNERNRLSELMPQLQRSPLSGRSDGSRQHTPNRASQTPFLSCLDR